MKMLLTLALGMVGLAGAARAQAQQPRPPLPGVGEVEQRYRGDTLWLTGKGARAGFVQRQVFASGAQRGPDTITVAWFHVDSLKHVDSYLFAGDSIWVLRGGLRQVAAGTAVLFAKALRVGWIAHHERISTMLLTP